jgi:predicted phage terminase large subunit-like protein
VTDIGPQPGPQEAFLSTPADIAIYGGAAGSGKSYALLLDPLRYVRDVAGFGGVIFRRNATQIRNEGGLWDGSSDLYPLFGGQPRETLLEWRFPPHGNGLKFAHLEYEKDVHSWQGAQIAFIGFDELTHFSKRQFFYMLSRNRSLCGVRPYIRATTNPDADSWVAEFIAWWIDQETGLPIPERGGILRWMVRIDDTLQWGDSPDELAARFPDQRPLSVTFIPATLTDNAILEARNPEYRANLMALSYVERERLLNGNWKVKPTAGTVFRREWFEVVDAVPKGLHKVRRWDMAGTAPRKGADPDWTVGLLLGELDSVYYVLDVFRAQGNAATIDPQRLAVANQDGRAVMIREEQEGGSAGKRVIEISSGNLFDGFDYRGEPSTGSKEVRARPVAAAAFNGRVKILRAPWNEAFLAELHSFPDGAHDDQVDALAGAYSDLVSSKPGATIPLSAIRTPRAIPTMGGSMRTIPRL